MNARDYLCDIAHAEMSVEEIMEKYAEDVHSRRMHSTQFTKVDPEPQLVRSWEEAFDGGNWLINRHCRIVPNHGATNHQDCKNHFRTEAQAKSALAFAQLSHIVADANERCAQFKSFDKWHRVFLSVDGPCVLPDGAALDALKMKSHEIAKACLKMHPQLWADYFMIERPKPDK